MVSLTAVKRFHGLGPFSVGSLPSLLIVEVSDTARKNTYHCVACGESKGASNRG